MPGGTKTSSGERSAPSSSGLRSSTSFVLVTAVPGGDERRVAEDETLAAGAHGGADSFAQPDRERRVRVRYPRAVPGSVTGQNTDKPGREDPFQRRLDVVGADLAQFAAHDSASISYRGVMVWARYASDRSE